MPSPFGWSYPPGVTGREIEIAGPDSEEDEVRYCPDCDREQDGLTVGYRGHLTWECGTCGRVEEWDAEDERDYEAEAELRREAMEDRDDY